MRKILYSILLLGLLVFFLPTLLSTSWGKARLEHYLEGHLGGEVTIQSLKLSWTDKQTCRGVCWKKPDSTVECVAEEILCDAPLLECLSYKSHSLDLFLMGGKITSPSKIKILRKEKDFHIRFTPVKAKVVKGTIAFEHTQIHLNEKLQLNMEGTLNLANNHLDVQLGIPSETLKKMFKMKELPAGYVLEVPLSCKLSSKELEKKLIRIFLKNYAKVISSQR